MNLTLDNRNRRYIEDSKQVYSLLGDIMIGTDGYEWLGGAAVSNRNGTQLFGNLQNHYDGPVEYLKRVAKANQVLEKKLTTRMKIKQLLLKFMLQG